MASVNDFRCHACSELQLLALWLPEQGPGDTGQLLFSAHTVHSFHTINKSTVRKAGPYFCLWKVQKSHRQSFLLEVWGYELHRPKFITTETRKLSILETILFLRLGPISLKRLDKITEAGSARGIPVF